VNDEPTTEARLRRLEHELHRARAVYEVQNVMARYEVLHTPAQIARTTEVFAMSRADVSFEISDWGVWQGPEAVTHLFEVVMQVPRRGTLTEAHLTTPMVQIAGDGETAKAVFWSPGVEILPSLGDQAVGDGGEEQLTTYWVWGKYAADFIREEGEWKIWHLRWFRLLRNDYYRSPVDSYREMMTGAPGSPEFPGVLPPTFHHPYSPEDERTPIPVGPEPYETYDGSFDWWFGEWKDREGYVPPRYEP
jgi:hypothetical protein